MFDILLNIGMPPEKAGKPLCNNGMKGKILYRYGGGDDSKKESTPTENGGRAVLWVTIS